jgi:hypothetical protein
VATCEIFDPATNAFSETTPMSEVRTGAIAVALLDGSVLVCGGTDGNIFGAIPAITSCDRYR